MPGLDFGPFSWRIGFEIKTCSHRQQQAFRKRARALTSVCVTVGESLSKKKPAEGWPKEK